MSIEIIGQHLPIIEEGDKLPELIEQETDYQEDDVLVISETIVSRARGRTRKLEEVRVGEKAKQLSKENDKDPRICQLILNKASEIIATGEGFVITEINGLVCANAGIDLSNSKEGKAILPLKNPNKIAEEYSQKLGGGVIISDSVGRSFRRGAVGLAIGYSGLSPFSSYIGQKDLFGREM
ncbi:F420-0--gamma-glutamyl ligase, partial [archaeon SCG-AAA382B04]